MSMIRLLGAEVRDQKEFIIDVMENKPYIVVFFIYLLRSLVDIRHKKILQFYCKTKLQYLRKQCTKSECILYRGAIVSNLEKFFNFASIIFFLRNCLRFLFFYICILS